MSRWIFGGSSKAEAEKKTKDTGKGKEKLKSSRPSEKTIETFETLPPLVLPEETSLLASEGYRIEKISPPPKAAPDPKALSSISLPDSVETPKPEKTSDSAKTPGSAKIPDSAKTPGSLKTPELTKTAELAKAAELAKTAELAKADELAKTAELAKADELAKIPDSKKTPEAAQIPESGISEMLKISNQLEKPGPEETKEPVEEKAAFEVPVPLESLAPVKIEPIEISDILKVAKLPEVTHTGELISPLEAPANPITSNSGKTADLADSQKADSPKPSPFDEILNLLKTPEPVEDEGTAESQSQEVSCPGEVSDPAQKAETTVTPVPAETSEAGKSKDSKGISDLLATINSITSAENQKYEEIEGTEEEKEESRAPSKMITEPELEPAVSEPVESEPVESEFEATEPAISEPSVPATPVTTAGISTDTLLKSIAELTGELKEAPEMETLKMENTEIEAPEIKNQEIEEPEIENPEIETQEIKSPEIKSPEIKSPEIKSPEIKSPEIKSSEIEPQETESPKIEENAAEVKAEVPYPGNGNAPDELLERKIAARMIIEALRLGGVPFSGVGKYSVGREKEFLEAYDWLDSGRGTLQVIGEYGSGKTHFLEMLSETALSKNWGVARVEIDAQETPFHKPHQLYESFVNNFRFVENGVLCDFRAFLTLLNESENPEAEKLQDHPYLGKMQEAWQDGKDRDLLFEWIEGKREGPAGFPVLQKHQTAANIYANLLSGLSWAAKSVLGLEGILILFDEAETVDPYWYTDYQFDKALNTLRGFVMLSNSDEALIDDAPDADGLGKKSGLVYNKMTKQPVPYLWEKESNLKLIFSFVPEMLESMEMFSKIASVFSSMDRIEIETLDEPSLQTLLGNIEKIYSEAYGYSAEKDLYSYLPLDRPRNFVKSAVEGLDLLRYHPDNGSDGIFK